MVKHQPLQYYEPQLCLSCLTGIYGCRWKRYQRSHDDTTKWELLWFAILAVAFFLTLTWFYFWWEVENDYNEFNRFLYSRTGHWDDWSIPILIAAACGFTYITVLLMLALCHVAVGQQLNLHWAHKAFLVVILVAVVVAMASVEQMWEEEWGVLLVSFQATAPFLHIGALVAVTMLAWIVAGQFARSEKVIFQVCVMMAYLAVIIALYLVPLTISSPCIMDKKDLGPKPRIIGHTGAPMLAPENTLMSFRRALDYDPYGLEADVRISYDGIPFLMHDNSLRRTTNVEEVFPPLASQHPSMVNWTDLEALNAGEWFLKADPFWTVSSLSPLEKFEAGNQSICKLSDLLKLAKESNVTVFLKIPPLPPDHPRSASHINITVNTILTSGVPQENVIWFSDSDRSMVQKMAPGFHQASNIKKSSSHLRAKGISVLNLRYTEVSDEDIREYSSENITLNVHTVNKPWLYSVLWCSGVRSVSSDAPHILRKVPFPIWLLPPDEYSLIWITSDLISFTVVLGIFILQKWRLGSIRTYNPEQIMLSAAVRRTSKDVRIMKEKLIFSEINSSMDTAEELSLCSENRYDGFANDGVSPSADARIHAN
ncbi:glycerophosphodiester phosphodiesterase domain-containing protein 5 isoform X2 [Spea bombifrons]|uniref:glycerophosphodiester phosphodiesterase domain-containing protein 5 isoform X2 n=1 Tax=Spea bombifrons TaxID=233779 RepID=UPI00234A421B|nr:glycerophosphodiester phosphodiesterase domain-containing protein 5 isoform X2 [Spea bombifrons]